MQSHFTGRACLFIGLYLCSVPLLVMQRKYVLLFDGLVTVFPLHKSKDAALCM